MSDSLHILNGDSTLWAMGSINMPGHKLVWRDILSEGPVISDFDSAEFWAIRAQFMHQNYGASPEDFQAKCIDEFRRLENLSGISELILWFEYDLFCQVNMLGILHYLNKAALDIPVSLVCVGQEPGSERLVALGEMAPNEFPRLFEERKLLTKEDLNDASKIFQAYCAADPRKIHQALTENSTFPYLKGAFDTHMKRFPFQSTGLNEIETVLVKIINEGAQNPREAVGKILQWQKETYYGFGDSQYFNCLKRLDPLIDQDFSIQLDAGIGLINRDYMLGGAKVGDWLWDDRKKRLIPSEINPLSKG